MSSHAVGIDLGTTYSAVARIDEKGRTSMLRSAEGELLTPSVVYFDRDETIVGRDAKKARLVAPDSVAECAKRDMGSPAYSRLINGQSLPPEVIQACILRKLRKDTVSVLGDNIKVVVTVPAYFDETRRKATADAGEMAGLEVLNIVNEPTAAALAFGEQLGYLSETGAPREHMRVLVYDLGGGTFDVTVIELKPGEIVTLATDGDVQLGGYDWDKRLVEHIADAFGQQTQIDLRSDSAALAKLRGDVEEAKHTLTLRDKTSIRIDYRGRTVEIPVSRKLFEDLTEDLLERTAYTTRQVLASAGLQWQDVSRILLVGGSSRMPMVSAMLKRVSGITPDLSVNPDEAVARGAAIFADYLLSVQGENARLPTFHVTDVNSHSLGIEGINQQTMRKENVILIPRNTPLPKQVTRKFATKEDNQKSVVVLVLEGESTSPEQCTPIGRAVIRDLPFGLPQGTRVEVIYRYDTNGRLAVRARLPGTGNETRIELERESGISAPGLSRWKLVVTSDGGFQAYQQVIDELKRTAAAASSQPLPVTGHASSAATMPAPTSMHPPGSPGATTTDFAPVSAPVPAGTSHPGTMQPAGEQAPVHRFAPASPQTAPAATAAGTSAVLQNAAPHETLPYIPASAISQGNVAAHQPQGQGNATAQYAPLSSPAGGLPAMPQAAGGGPLTPIVPSVKPLPKVGAAVPANSPGEPIAPMSGPIGGGAAKLRPDFTGPGAGGANSATEDGGPAITDRLKHIKKKMAKLGLTTLIGHVLASTIGLALGYYVLCLVNPEANFLKISLPGVRQAAPAEADTPPGNSPSKPPAKASP